MTLDEAIAKKVAETGVERYRHLCLEHPDPAVRARYSAWVMGEPMPIQPPGLFKRLGTASKAAVRFARSGMATADQATVEERRSICRGCDRFDAEADMCRECGCYLAAKVRMASEACPLGKWPAVAATKAKCGGCGAK